MNKNEGFTLLELMIVVAIISIMVTAGSVALSGSFERNALMKMRVQIPTFLRSCFDKSYERGQDYEIVFNKNAAGDYKNIELQKVISTTSSITLKTLKLDGKLTYTVEGGADTFISSDRGNIDGERYIYIKKDGIPVYQVSIVPVGVIDYAVFTKYKAKSTLNATNYTDSSQWEEID